MSYQPPGFKSELYQRTLFENPIRTFGGVRNVAGDLAEYLTSKVTDAKRLRTSGNCSICPDLKFSDGVWFETKSVGTSNVVIIYQHRLEKEIQFEASGNKLIYWIWNHRASVQGVPTEEAVRHAIMSTLKSVIIADHESIQHIIQNSKVRTINSMYYSNHGKVHKGVGWAFPVKRFEGSICGNLKVLDREIPVISTFEGAEQYLKNPNVGILKNSKNVR